MPHTVAKNMSGETLTQGDVVVFDESFPQGPLTVPSTVTVATQTPVRLLIYAPGAERLPTCVRALSGDLTEASRIGVVVGLFGGGANVEDEALAIVQTGGFLDYEVAGSPDVGDPVYVDDDGALSLTPGSGGELVGHVHESTGGQYRIWIDEVSGGGGGAASSDYEIDPKSPAYGATGDGVTDDRLAIEEAIADAMATGKRLVFSPGDYLVGQAIYITGASHLHIAGVGAAILFPSSDTSLTTSPGDQWENNAVNRRSAFFFKASTDIVIENLRFEGDDVQDDFDINCGRAVATNETVHRLRVHRCTQEYGGGLVTQEDAASDTIVSDCYSYGSRNSSRVGLGGMFRNCTFELPTSSGYDPSGSSEGSTHAIYQFANSGSNVAITGCAFRNIRKDCIKISGSASALRSYIITVNRFYNCGFDSLGAQTGHGPVSFGADDVQTHSALVVQGNVLWNSMGFGILGARTVLIDGNVFHFSTDPASALQGPWIGVTQYTTTSQPVETVRISNNVFGSELAAEADSIGQVAIKALRVGHDITDRWSNVVIEGNQIGHGWTLPIDVEDCLEPIVRDNVIHSALQAMLFTNCRMPRVLGNDIVQRSTSAQIRFNHCSWPIVRGNRGANTRAANGRHMYVGVSDNNDSTTPCNFPLLGYSGRCVPTESIPEVVFAYGSGWTAGDTVRLTDETAANFTCTYTTGAPGANQFNNFASLVAWIEGLAKFTAADYGADFTPTIITEHIRVRFHTTSTTGDLFTLFITSANPTAGVMLVNTTLSNDDTMRSRGENTNRAVVWSPCVGLGEVPVLLAEETTASAALVLASPYPIVVDAGIGEAGADCTLQCGALAGTEVFQWKLS